MNWHDTGKAAPKSLTAARLQLHFGAYILGSTAHSVLDHADDDSHSNLNFEPKEDSLHTRELGNGLSLHLDLIPFELALRGGSGLTASLALSGQTLDSALSWVEEVLSAHGMSAQLSRREYPDFPESPIMSGGAFAKPHEDELSELALWFGNARELIESLGSGESRMSEARVWPHHFDLGALIPLSTDGSVSIGLGLSPGDAHFDQPYFYCSPYPAPEAGTSLPSLRFGHWTTDGFVSAILTAEEIQRQGSQKEAAQSYLSDAMAGCRLLLQESA